MGSATKTLYETDFLEWAAQTAELLRRGRYAEVDVEHVVEEIEDLAKRDRAAARSQLRRMLMHFMKQRIQPERAGKSWRASIENARVKIQDMIGDSPSLRRHLEENLDKVFREAVKLALAETGLEDRRDELEIPDHCPWTVDELLEGGIGELQRR